MANLSRSYLNGNSKVAIPGSPPRRPEVEGKPIIRFSGILSNSNPLPDPEPDPDVAGVGTELTVVVGQLPLLDESVSDP